MAEIQAEEKKKADKIQILMAKIEAHTKLKKMELKAQPQASTSATVDPPPHNRDAKPPKLPAFVDEKDELYSYLLRFERCAQNGSYEKNNNYVGY